MDPLGFQVLRGPQGLAALTVLGLGFRELGSIGYRVLISGLGFKGIVFMVSVCGIRCWSKVSSESVRR